MYFSKGTIALFCLLMCSISSSPQLWAGALNVNDTRMGGHEESSLSLNDVVQQVQKQNIDIIISDIGRSIARQKVTKEESIFEPFFKAAMSHQDRHVPTDAATAASLSSLLTWKSQSETEQNDYTDKTNDYSLSAQQKLPTGGAITVGTTFQERSNDQIDANYPKEVDPKEYQTVFSAELRQPLLKGAWTDVTMAGIKVAKTDLAIARETYRKKMMQVIFQAIQRYWNVYSAQENLVIQEDSVHLTQKLLQESKKRVQAGKMAPTALLQFRSGILKRRTQVSKARQELEDAIAGLSNLLAETAWDRPGKLHVQQNAQSFDFPDKFKELLLHAYQWRPEYRASRLQAKRLKTQLVVAKNNRLPQLDLTASFKRNGLDVQSDESFQQALQDNFNSWSVGVELTIPLGGDIKSRSELAALAMQQRQALLKIKSAEIAIANSIETSLQNVHNAREQLRLHTANTHLMHRLLEIEIQKLRSGHTTTRDVLLREDDLNTAKQAELKSRILYRNSLARLALAQGSLLEQFDLDIPGEVPNTRSADHAADNSLSVPHS